MKSLTLVSVVGLRGCEVCGLSERLTSPRHSSVVDLQDARVKQTLRDRLSDRNIRGGRLLVCHFVIP